MQKEIGFLLIIKNKTNKNNPVGEKTDWQAGQDRTGQDRTGQDRTGQDRTGQDRTGQDRTGQDRTGQVRTGQVTRHTSNDDEPTQNCKHKEIIKGANEEGNEGEQLGKINQ